MKERTISRYAEEVFSTPENESFWFGYYNYDVLNADQTRLLCNRIETDGIAPEKGIEIEVGYFSLSDGQWHPLSRSDSWNWQQGCMAQWLPNKGNGIVFNFSDRGRLKSAMIDTDTNSKTIIEYPIYGISPDGHNSISIELERSYWCRAYHYQSVVNKSMDVNIFTDDGIFKIDLKSGKRKRIISINDIIAAHPAPNFMNMKHWVEHVMINQKGTKFCFLHRFSPPYDVNLYQTRLFVADIDGTNLQLISGWEKTDLSHFGWNGDDFAIYTVANNGMASSYKSLGQSSTSSNASLKQSIFKSLVMLARILPPSIRRKLKGGNSYYGYHKCGEDGIYYKTKEIKGGFFDIDGHPSFTADGRYMITDTYPDPKGYQHLMVYDLITDKSLEIARFFAYYHHTPASCDLHPKLCRNNNYVAVDSAYNTHHHTILLKLNWDLIKAQLD